MDIYTDTGVLQYHIKSAFSEYEVKKIRKRTEAGIIRSFLEGNYASPHSPFGYDKVDKELMIKENEATFVREIHNTYLLEGMSIIGTAHYMNCSDCNDTRWSENKIRKILYSMVYVGEVERQDLGQTFKNIVPPIVDSDIKKLVLEKLSINTRNTLSSSKHRFLSKVYCTKCDNRCICDTHYRKNKIYRYYECKNCNLRINENIILQLVSPGVTDLLLKELSESIQKKIRKKITEFRRHQVALLNMLNESYISKKTYRKEVADLSQARSKYLQKKEIELNVKVTLENMTLKESKKILHDASRRLKLIWKLND